MQIREAQHTDIPEITAIYNWALTETDLSPVPGPVTEQSRSEWLTEIQADGFPVFVAVDGNGAVLGFAGYSQLAFDALFPNTVEDTIYIAEHAAGQGVGSALMDALVSHARDNAYVTSIISYVAANNEASLRLHEKFGFEIAGTLFGIGEKQGKRLDLCHMQLLFDGPTNAERAQHLSTERAARKRES